MRSLAAAFFNNNNKNNNKNNNNNEHDAAALHHSQIHQTRAAADTSAASSAPTTDRFVPRPVTIKQLHGACSQRARANSSADVSLGPSTVVIDGRPCAAVSLCGRVCHRSGPETNGSLRTRRPYSLLTVEDHTGRVGAVQYHEVCAVDVEGEAEAEGGSPVDNTGRVSAYIPDEELDIVVGDTVVLSGRLCFSDVDARLTQWFGTHAQHGNAAAHVVSPGGHALSHGGSNHLDDDDDAAAYSTHAPCVSGSKADMSARNSHGADDVIVCVKGSARLALSSNEALYWWLSAVYAHVRLTHATHI